MLASARASAALPAQDFARARSFYADKLGLKPTVERESHAMYELGSGTRFLLFQSTGAPSGDHTQVGFEVDDFDDVIATLRSNGVELLEYDMPGTKIEDGIMTMEDGSRGVFIKDSEGNLIGITEPLKF